MTVNVLKNIKPLIQHCLSVYSVIDDELSKRTEFVESWIQINLFRKRFVFSKKKQEIKSR